MDNTVKLKAMNRDKFFDALKNTPTLDGLGVQTRQNKPSNNFRKSGKFNG